MVLYMVFIILKEISQSHNREFVITISYEIEKLFYSVIVVVLRVCIIINSMWFQLSVVKI